MDIYNFVREKYNEQQKTGKSSIKFPELCIRNKNLQVKASQIKNKDMNTTKSYSCGHPVETVVINTTVYTLSLYSEWLHNNPHKYCLKCWINDRNNKKN